jgi:hypothetical protein
MPDIKEKILNFLRKNTPRPVLKSLQNRLVYGPEIRDIMQGRDKVPLFTSVALELRTRCNGTCAFCPASVQNDTREDKLMPPDIYKKVLRELVDLEFTGTIKFFLNNEPLICPQLTEFIAMAREALPKCWFTIATNGKALTTKKLKELLEAGLNKMAVNVYRKSPDDELPMILKEIRDQVIPNFFKSQEIEKLPNYGLRIKDKFEMIVNPRLVGIVMTTRGGTSPNKPTPTNQPRGFCWYPFTLFPISTDGAVAQCCADFYIADPMGNVTRGSIPDIWYGEKFSFIREELLKGNRKTVKNCSQCDLYGVTLHKENAGWLRYLIYLLTKY